MKSAKKIPFFVIIVSAQLVEMVLILFAPTNFWKEWLSVFKKDHKLIIILW